MMILVILIVVLAAGFFIAGLGEFRKRKARIKAEEETKNIKDAAKRNQQKLDLIGNTGESCMLWGSIFAVLGAILLFLFILCGYLPAHYGNEGMLAEKQEEYNLLLYKTHHEPYIDENGEPTEELLKEIQKWNEEVAKNSKMNDDFWVGVFYEDYWDELQTIPLE